MVRRGTLRDFSAPVDGHGRAGNGPSGRVRNMDDRPEARNPIWSASERVPASAATMTSPRRWADSNALVTDINSAV
jgi:hypothetical protein